MTEQKKTRVRRMARPLPHTSPAESGGQQPDGAKAAKAVKPAPEKKPRKTEIVLNLLRRAEGANLDDLIAATGWLPHTTRAALSGLRKKGHVIDKTKVDGTTRYSVAAEPQP